MLLLLYISALLSANQECSAGHKLKAAEAADRTVLATLVGGEQRFASIFSASATTAAHVPYRDRDRVVGSDSGEGCSSGSSSSDSFEDLLRALPASVGELARANLTAYGRGAERDLPLTLNPTGVSDLLLIYRAQAAPDERSGKPIVAAVTDSLAQGVATAIKIEQHLRMGFTAVLTRADFRNEALGALCRRLEGWWGQSCQVNVYETRGTAAQDFGRSPGSGQTAAFGTHWDVSEGFIVQARGTKRWNIYAPVPEFAAPYTEHGIGADVAQARFGAPLRTILLRRGDVLHVPRGVPHDAVPGPGAVDRSSGGGDDEGEEEEEEGSLHFTVSVHSAEVTLTDWFEQLFHEAARKKRPPVPITADGQKKKQQHKKQKKQVLPPGSPLGDSVPGAGVPLKVVLTKRARAMERTPTQGLAPMRASYPLSGLAAAAVGVPTSGVPAALAWLAAYATHASGAAKAGLPPNFSEAVDAAMAWLAEEANARALFEAHGVAAHERLLQKRRNKQSLRTVEVDRNVTLAAHELALLSLDD